MRILAFSIKSFNIIEDSCKVGSFLFISINPENACFQILAESVFGFGFRKYYNFTIDGTLPVP
jgi:hypothetical protein